MADALRVILAAFALVLVLMIGTAVVGTFEEGESGIRMAESPAVLLDGTGEYTRINDDEGFDETVYNSLGNAVNLSGSSDSYVRSTSSVEFATDENWTVSVWASQAPNAALQQRAVVSLNGRLIIYHQPVAGNWSAWLYDDGSTDSYIVNVSTSGGPGALQNVVVWSNGTHLSIYRNNTQGDIKNITTENIADAPVSSANWHGRLDELRTFDDALNNSQRQQLVDSPVDPLPSANRTARVMFDEADKSEQLLFFASGSMSQSNVAFSPGLAGSVMDGQSTINDIVGATDYVWDIEGPRIYVVAGGELDGAPVAYVDYDLERALSSTVDAWADAVQLAAIIPLIAFGLLILARVRGL